MNVKVLTLQLRAVSTFYNYQGAESRWGLKNRKYINILCVRQLKLIFDKISTEGLIQKLDKKAEQVVVLYGDGAPEMANGAIKQRQAHFNPWMCRAGFKDNFCGKYKHLTTKWKLKMGNCMYSSENGIMVILVQLSRDQVSDMIHTNKC